ncbi:Uncharacterised protein [Serratia fonticola]|jgi:hypothetical protein|nr:hypothetical protein HAP32_04843 [Serratia fonticola]CAI0956436.1 Uncharacterised protein [Serratia fonticola]
MPLDNAALIPLRLRMSYKYHFHQKLPLLNQAKGQIRQPAENSLLSTSTLYPAA